MTSWHSCGDRTLSWTSMKSVMGIPGGESRWRDSADADQLHLEDEHRVGRDGTEVPLAVAELGGDDEPALATHPHADDALVPALNHLALAEREGEGLSGGAAGVEQHAV